MNVAIVVKVVTSMGLGTINQVLVAAWLVPAFGFHRYNKMNESFSPATDRTYPFPVAEFQSAML